MSLTVSITLDDVYTALGNFIESVLPAGVVVVQVDENRVATPPPDPGYVEMMVRSEGRIMTNLDQWDPTDVDPSAINIMQAVQLAVQLDCYGATSGDWAVILSTVLRDEYGITALAPSGVVPLFTKSPMNAPLVNAELQYEKRWIVEAAMQYNPVVSTPMQFADTANVTLIEVDERYPP